MNLKQDREPAPPDEPSPLDDAAPPEDPVPFEEPGPLDDAVRLDELAFTLIRSAALFTRSIGRLTGVAYSSIAWRVLADLEQYGAARVSDLAQQQRVAQPSMTALVQRLSAEGWVTKGADPGDGRATLVQLAAEGGIALRDYRAACAAQIAPLLTELDGTDIAALARAASLMLQLGDGPRAAETLADARETTG